jgi:hypothetical protein
MKFSKAQNVELQFCIQSLKTDMVVWAKKKRHTLNASAKDVKSKKTFFSDKSFRNLSKIIYRNIVNYYKTKNILKIQKFFVLFSKMFRTKK